MDSRTTDDHDVTVLIKKSLCAIFLERFIIDLIRASSPLGNERHWFGRCVNRLVLSVTGAISTLIALFTCVAGAFLNMRALIIFHLFDSQTQKQHHEDYRLLSTLPTK